MRIFRRIKRIFSWIPVLWKDEEFDWAYLLRILRKKISMMKANFEKAQFYEGWEEDVRDMQIALDTIDRIENSTYDNNKFISITQAERFKQADINFLFSFMARRLQYWWW